MNDESLRLYDYTSFLHDPSGDFTFFLCVENAESMKVHHMEVEWEGKEWKGAGMCERGASEAGDKGAFSNSSAASGEPVILPCVNWVGSEQVNRFNLNSCKRWDI